MIFSCSFSITTFSFLFQLFYFEFQQLYSQWQESKVLHPFGGIKYDFFIFYTSLIGFKVCVRVLRTAIGLLRETYSWSIFEIIFCLIAEESSIEYFPQKNNHILTSALFDEVPVSTIFK